MLTLEQAVRLLDGPLLNITIKRRKRGTKSATAKYTEHALEECLHIWRLNGWAVRRIGRWKLDKSPILARAGTLEEVLIRIASVLLVNHGQREQIISQIGLTSEDLTTLDREFSSALSLSEARLPEA